MKRPNEEQIRKMFGMDGRQLQFVLGAHVYMGQLEKALEAASVHQKEDAKVLRSQRKTITQLLKDIRKLRAQIERMGRRK